MADTYAKKGAAIDEHKRDSSQLAEDHARAKTWYGWLATAVNAWVQDVMPRDKEQEAREKDLKREEKIQKRDKVQEEQGERKHRLWECSGVLQCVDCGAKTASKTGKAKLKKQ